MNNPWYFPVWKLLSQFSVKSLIAIVAQVFAFVLWMFLLDSTRLGTHSY
jgi:hypothetical protein